MKTQISKTISDTVRLREEFYENHRQILILHDQVIDSSYSCFYSTIKITLVFVAGVFIMGFFNDVASESIRLILAVGFGLMMSVTMIERDRISESKRNKELYKKNHVKDANEMESEYKKFLNVLDKIDEQYKK